MKTFANWLLIEADLDSKKLQHLTHVEDLPTSAGKSGARHAFVTLHQIHRQLTGKVAPVSVSSKFDGSPSVIFGHHPETGKFFVGTKAAFSKNPKINYTDEDIERNHGEHPGLVASLKHSLHHLPKIVPGKGVYQGDLMYSSDSVHHSATEHSFTPNTLTYSVKADSDQGRKVSNSKLGIVVHTRYHGNTISDMSASPGDYSHELKQHPDVNLISPKYAMTKSPTYAKLYQNKVSKHLGQALHSYNAVKDWDATKSHKPHLMKYFNHTVRTGETPSTENYSRFLKTNNASAKIQSTAKDTKHLINMHNHLTSAKHILINHLNKGKSDFTYSINGKKSNPEGYVAAHGNRMVKLVNRKQFSAANFAKHVVKEMLLEGGNIKLKTGQSAVPLMAADRTTHQISIHNTMSAIHDSFKTEHGADLFGKDKKALSTGSAYAGSTRHLMNKTLSNAEYSKYKPSTGDVDVQIPKQHLAAIANHLKPGREFGDYKVQGIKKHGLEVSAIMQHKKSGQNHQIDFEGSEYHNNEPTKGEQFQHSSSWEDTKHGIKGAHHKMLLNAAAGTTHKFSTAYGLRSRTDESDPGTTDPKQISQKLFGKGANHTQVHSMIGLTSLIKKHIPVEQHQAIYDKFKSSVSKMPGSEAALTHLKSNLHQIHESLIFLLKSIIREENDPDKPIVMTYGRMNPPTIGHMAVVKKVRDLAKKKHADHQIILSHTQDSKKNPLAPHRKLQYARSLFGKGTNVELSTKDAPSIFHHATKMYEKGYNHLHVVVGADRVKEFKTNLDKYNGRFTPEGKGYKFRSITVHSAGSRTGKGLAAISSTGQRAAAKADDYDTFKQGLPKGYPDRLGKHMMTDVKRGLK